MTYLHQMMSPFLLIFIFSTLPKKNNHLWLSLPFIIFSAEKSISKLNYNLGSNINDIDVIEKTLEGHHTIFTTPTLIHLLVKQGKPIIDNGHTRYFLFGSNNAEFLADKGKKKTEAIWDEYLNHALYKKVINQEFDLIITDKYSSLYNPRNNPRGTHQSGETLLKQHYKKSSTMPYQLADRLENLGGNRYDITIWEPINP